MRLVIVLFVLYRPDVPGPARFHTVAILQQRDRWSPPNLALSHRACVANVA